jgi:hypothetical protein
VCVARDDDIAHESKLPLLRGRAESRKPRVYLVPGEYVAGACVMADPNRRTGLPRCSPPTRQRVQGQQAMRRCQSTRRVEGRALECIRAAWKYHHYHRAKLDDLTYVDWIDPAYWRQMEELAKRRMYD